MSLAWIAQVVFFLCYSLGYYFKMTFAHSVWGFLTALAAFIIAVLLIIDNRGIFNRP